MVKIWLVCVFLLMIAFSGCTEKKPQPLNVTVEQTTVAATPSITVAEPSTVYVEIKGSIFNPSELVVIQGTTVRWTNKDSATHNIFVDGFESPPMNKREAWNHTFIKKGRYEYSCLNHPSIPHGRILVE